MLFILLPWQTRQLEPDDSMIAALWKALILGPKTKHLVK